MRGSGFSSENQFRQGFEGEASKVFLNQYSGGSVWIPGNRYGRAAGAEDSAAKAETYLRQLITEEEVPEYQLDAFLENGPKMVDFLHERTQVRYVTLEHYPDYYTSPDGAMEGHRSMEPETFQADKLGDEWRRLRRTHPMMHLAGVIGFTQVEAALLIGQQPGCKDNTGDAIQEGLRLGAKMRRLSEAWWCNTISVPGEEIPRLSSMEKSYPGSIMVNPAGERFSNESQNYMAFQLETFEKHSEENLLHPTWQIFDANFRASYFVGPIVKPPFYAMKVDPGDFGTQGAKAITGYQD